MDPGPSLRDEGSGTAAKHQGRTHRSAARCAPAAFGRAGCRAGGSAATPSSAPSAPPCPPYACPQGRMAVAPLRTEHSRGPPPTARSTSARGWRAAAAPAAGGRRAGRRSALQADALPADALQAGALPADAPPARAPFAPQPVARHKQGLLTTCVSMQTLFHLIGGQCCHGLDKAVDGS